MTMTNSINVKPRCTCFMMSTFQTCVEHKLNSNAKQGVDRATNSRANM